MNRHCGYQQTVLLAIDGKDERTQRKTRAVVSHVYLHYMEGWQRNTVEHLYAIIFNIFHSPQKNVVVNPSSLHFSLLLEEWKQIDCDKACLIVI